MSMLFLTKQGGLAKVIAAIAGLALGVGLAFLMGQFWPPIERYNPTPLALRQDYKDEYIRLVALAYKADEDLDTARSRLSLLQSDDPTRPLLELIERWVGEGRDRYVVAPLITLARDLGAESPSMIKFEQQGVP